MKIMTMKIMIIYDDGKDDYCDDENYGDDEDNDDKDNWLIN